MFTTKPAYFRGNAKFGRTTELYLNGILVLTLMGIISKKQMLQNYQSQA